MKPFPTVAIMNGSAELMDTLTTLFEMEGYNTASIHIDDVKRGHVDFICWLDRHDPQIVIYDVGAPFEENLNFLKLLETSGKMKGRCLIVTTTNLKAFRQVADRPANVHEILGKPFDLEQLLATVNKTCGKVLQPS
jgi:DNA-binding response OmpR family regulator